MSFIFLITRCARANNSCLGAQHPFLCQVALGHVTLVPPWQEELEEEARATMGVFVPMPVIKSQFAASVTKLIMARGELSTA